MTNTSRLIAIANIIALIVASRSSHLQLAVLSLTLLLWMLAAYLVFRIRCWQLYRGLRITRSIQDRGDATGYLWAGRTYNIRIAIASKGARIRGVRIRDIVPDILEFAPMDPTHSTDGTSRVREWLNEYDPEANTKKIKSEGSSKASEDRRSVYQHQLLKLLRSTLKWITAVDAGETIHDAKHRQIDGRVSGDESNSKEWSFHYHVRPKGPGIAVLPGVRLEFHDSMRWFRWDDMLPFEQKFTILPSHHEGAELQSLLKKNNSIPQHGIHRNRRPGMGFELLELREYRDGDPPKSIAWKASARRETLMTRQYESEIPVRVQLIVEGTLPTRIGSFGLRTIDQIATVATSLTRIATQNGDWVGANIVAGHKIHNIASASGNKGFYGIAQAFSRLCSEGLPGFVDWNEPMQTAAYELASEYYPKLLSRSINPTGYRFIHGLISRNRRRHVQLSNLFAARYRLSTLAHAKVLSDRLEFAKLLQRFLSEHGQAWLMPMLPTHQVNKAMRPAGWNDVISSLQRAVLRAKDNEVFVLFIDLVGVSRPLEPLIQALRMAKGRHHRVVVISSSPYFELPHRGLQLPQRADADSLRDYADKLKIAEQAIEVRRAIRELGIPFAISSTMDMVPSILAEIELARSGRFSKTGALS